MTGYTHKVPEGQSFNDFVMTCARAMGALIMMRDEPMDAPIPEFQPSEYNLRELAKAEQELLEWDAMTDDQKRDWANAQVLEANQRHKEYVAQVNTENAALDAMLAQVNAWTPPTPDHENFKSFMVEQLTISKSDPPKNWYADTAEERIASRREKLLNDIKWHKKQYAEDVERTNGRNAWVNALKDSLKVSA